MREKTAKTHVSDTAYYPVLLDLRHRRCIVIGGGVVAERKVGGLLGAEARVTVVSPDLTRALRVLADRGEIIHIARRYRHGDLADAFLVIGATDEKTVNEDIRREADERDVLVNVADDPSRCSFVAPSVMRRGDLTVAVSTGGKAPALAVRLREEMERSIGDEYARFLEIAGRLRGPLAERHPDFAIRKKLWYELVDSDVLDLLRRGDERAAQNRIAEITGVALTDGSGDERAYLGSDQSRSERSEESLDDKAI